MDLTPIGEPPNRSARWCPSCAAWMDRSVMRGRRRCACGTAVVRQVSRHDRPLPGELRPGIVGEFDDPRDRYDPSQLIANLRVQLQGNYEARV